MNSWHFKLLTAFTLLGLTSISLYAQPEKSTSLNLDTSEAIILAPDSNLLYSALADDPLLFALDSMLSLLGVDSTFVWQSDSIALLDSLAPTFPSNEVLAERMALLNARSPIDLRYNSNVHRFIELYVKSRREQMSRMLGDAEYYFPMFEASLEKYEIPMELKYLAIVESALNPQAVSSARARGLWQFMLPTGRLFGLNVDSYIDERHDPVQATDAACRYLKQLYGMFGDWNLALAAYNSGPGNVRKAIRRSGGKRDFWEIKAYLPRETRSYVPAFTAVNYAFNYANEHGIYAKKPNYTYYQIDTVMIKEAVHFDQLGALLSITAEELEKLNPQFIRQYVPGSAVKGGAIPFVLPFEKAGLYVSYQDSIHTLIALEKERKELLGIEEEPAIEHITHRVRSGESLGIIAQRYGVRVSDIKEWNNLRSTVIHSGQHLTLYSTTDKGAKKVEKKKAVIVQSDEKTDVYLVQPGDTLYDIAKKYPGVTADHIMEWNDIRSAKSLKPGMRIKILKNS